MPSVHIDNQSVMLKTIYKGWILEPNSDCIAHHIPACYSSFILLFFPPGIFPCHFKFSEMRLLVAFWIIVF